MVSAPTSAMLPRRHSLLGHAVAPLTLQIIGGEYDQRCVELTSAKVTIGSAAHCTLRLVGCGLAAVELFLLRGHAGTLVQNASPRNRLNGRAFTEAQLVAGDRLAVGSVEFELRDTVGSEKQQREPVSSNEELQLPYSQDGQEIETLRQRIDLLEQEQRNDHAHWRAEQEQWIEELMQARQRGIQLQETLDEQASGASQLAQEELQELRQQRDQLQQEAGRLTSQLAKFNSWQERASQAESQLEQANQARQAVEQELRQQNQTLTLDLSQAQAEQTELAAALQQLSDLQQQREQLESELADASLTIDSLQQTVAQQQEQCAVEQELQDQLATLQQEHQALRDEAQAREASLQEVTEQVAALELDLAERKHHAPATEQAAGKTVASNSDNEKALAELLQLRAQLEQREAELNHLEKHLTEKEAMLQPHESGEHLPTQVMGSQAESQAANDTAADNGQHTIVLTGNDSSAQATADRLLNSGSDDYQLQATLDPSETAADEHRSAAAESEELVLDTTLDFVPQAERDSQFPSEEASIAAPVSTAATPQLNSNEEEAVEADDSIRQYMDQLMRRVRGESTQTASLTTTPEPKQEVNEEPAAAPVDFAKQAEAPVTPEVMSSEQYTPRSSAPEKTDNLAKMREVANTSARTAIDTASKAERQKAAAINLLMATAAAGAGATLIAYSSAGLPVVRYATAATALGAAAWWAYCAVTYAMGTKALPTHSLLRYLQRASKSKQSDVRADEISQQARAAEESEEQLTDAE